MHIFTLTPQGWMSYWIKYTDTMNKPLKITLISLGGLAAVLLLTFLCLLFDVPSRARMLWHRAFCRPDDYIKKEILWPQRGRIFDKEGNVLCQDRELIDIYMDCCVVEDSGRWADGSRALADSLGKMLPGRTADEWYEYFQNARSNHKRYIPIAQDISFQMKDSLAKLPLYRDGQYGGGIITEYSYPREYPYGTLARRTLGYVKGTGSSSDFNTHVGLEGSYNTYLFGRRGERKVKYGMRRGRRRHWEVGYKEPQHGYDLLTTLDMRLQAVADSTLRAILTEEEDLDRAALVLMEVETGAIRVMANLMRNGDRTSVGEYYNNAIARCIEPGEVVQTMTLAKLLDDGVVASLESTIPTRHGMMSGIPYPQDVHIADYEREHKTSEISILDGYTMSSRYVMAKCAYDAYADSAAVFTGALRGYCLPSDVAFDLEGLRHADIRGPEQHPWTSADLCAMANGYSMMLTPMDILSFYNTIAARGKMVEPYLVQSVKYEGKDVKINSIKHFAKYLSEDVLQSRTCDTLTRALRENVLSGTATHLRDAKYPVAGKSGTSRQQWYIKDGDAEGAPGYTDKQGNHITAATFAGFFPADEPKYSVICVLESRPCHKTFYGSALPALAVKDLINMVEL